MQKFMYFKVPASLEEVFKDVVDLASAAYDLNFSIHPEFMLMMPGDHFNLVRTGVISKSESIFDVKTEFPCAVLVLCFNPPKPSKDDQD